MSDLVTLRNVAGVLRRNREDEPARIVDKAADRINGLEEEKTLLEEELKYYRNHGRKKDINRIEELEAENRIFRSTESVDDSVWDALLEQIRQHHDRIEELEAHGLCRCADEVRCDMRKLITACEPYLKDGETPAECIQRNRDDTGAVMKLLEKEKRKYDALLEGLCGLKRIPHFDSQGNKDYELIRADELRALLEDE